MRAPTRVAALFLALAAFCDASADAPAPLRIGVLAYRGTEEAERTWQSTFDHLARALPGRRVEIVGGTAAFLTAAVAANRLDFLITNPGHYLELKVNYSASALATEQELDGPTPAQAVGAAIFVPNGHPEIQTLADLRNLRIAAVASDAFGYRAATRELLERGVDPAFTPVGAEIATRLILDLCGGELSEHRANRRRPKRPNCGRCNRS